MFNGGTLGTTSSCCDPDRPSGSDELEPLAPEYECGDEADRLRCMPGAEGKLPCDGFRLIGGPPRSCSLCRVNPLAGFAEPHSVDGLDRSPRLDAELRNDGGAPSDVAEPIDAPRGSEGIG